MQSDIQKLYNELNDLKQKIDKLYSSSTIDRNIETALKERMNLNIIGILKGNGVNAITSIPPLSGAKTYYVADTSAGAVTRKLTFQDGILVAET